ncbi:DNA ligase D [Dokdonella immobilis]|uniref:DNA ligase (ATP) n=1 Tax=Dokdonella immobilis TaxID=578942 RepID=A0A1I4WS40_9GAMM|nr:DNA ligase D [Dokdonella immobilis]SFN16651.1 ATP-dependent DNA ligase LigD phosphoesterase module /ATP-dependent DNA ligase LigD polymerase module [Dokdonella immobilis]
MPLQTYRSKRDFSRTREPSAGGKRGGRRFVVQLHHASHRHYDFRLELDGALKSWAVPKGPSLDPTVKRLAVEVEDHPLAYATFEGDIAEGNYGAGHVDIFDSGTWEAEGSARAGLEAGELKFTLHGAILRGSWVLVRTRRRGGKPQWLLIKHRDAFARAAEADDFLDRRSDRPRATKRLPAKPAAAARQRRAAAPPSPEELPGSVPQRITTAAFKAELCKPADKPPRGSHWLHEPKWDGYRLLAAVAGGKVRLWSRNGIEWTGRLPAIARAIAGLGLRSARLDGEIIVLDDGRDSFNALQERLAGDNGADILYMLFDVIHADGRSFAEVPLLARKAWLAALLAAHPDPLLRYSEHEVGHGPALFAQAAANGLEGLVSKRIDSVYRGARNGDWVKSKARLSDEFIVVGFTEPKGHRRGLGALLLAKPHGRGLRYAGRVGTGIGNERLRMLRRRLDASVIDDAPVPTERMARADLDGAHWVTPELVVEVYFQGVGNRGLLRQPAFKALREDKSRADVAPDTVGHPAARRSGQSARTPRAERKNSAMANSRIEISHPQRLVYAETGRTKQDVADYYRAVAPWLLAEIEGRPLSIVRCPDGVGEGCFFQKHATRGIGKHVHGVMIREKSGRNRYLCIDDVEGLLELVQMNALEFHPWGARSAAPERADRMVFDLDPGPGASWGEVKRAARRLHRQLDSVGLQAFLRTSGGKGLHLVVPLKPSVEWDAVKAFARAVAEAMVKLDPERFVSVADKSRRKGRIFIDWLRNAHGATSIASYSLRARESAGVAMPIAWEDLARVRKPDQFTLKNALSWIDRRAADPWAAIARIEQSLPDLDAL